MRAHSKKIVLYADDDLDDKDWVNEALQEARVNMDIRFVENGKQVLSYLKSSKVNDFPSLIVLDLNMPELDGKQTIKILQSDPDYKSIPIVVVTTSSSKIDKDVCRKLGASLFLTKPDTYAEWKEMIRKLQVRVLNIQDG